MGMFEFRLVAASPLATTFKVFTDTNAWERATVVTSAQWVMGKPWELQSRLRIESDGLVASVSDQVLLEFEPNRRLAYLSHFLGITLESRVAFRAVSDRETEIHARLEVVGDASRELGFDVAPVMESSTRKFFDDLSAECERVARSEEKQKTRHGLL